MIDATFRKPPARGRRWENALKKPQLTRQKPVCQTQRAFVLWPGRAPQPQGIVDAVGRDNTTY